MGKYLYLYVTDDKYEFPLAVAETEAELAAMIGKAKSAVSNAFNRQKNGQVKDIRFKKVLIDEGAYMETMEDFLKKMNHEEMRQYAERIKSLVDLVVDYEGDDFHIWERQVRGCLQKLITIKKSSLRRAENG